MALVNLEIDSGELDRLALDVAATEPQAKQALNSTLRKMAAWLRARSARGLSKALGIPLREVRRRLKGLNLRSSGGGSEVSVWYGLNPIAMIYLQARQRKGGVKASGGRFVESAFIRKGRGGNRQVFKRRGQARLPIDKQSADIQEPAERYLEDELIGGAEFERQFFNTFERELKWRTRTR